MRLFLAISTNAIYLHPHKIVDFYSIPLYTHTFTHSTCLIHTTHKDLMNYVCLPFQNHCVLIFLFLVLTCFLIKTPPSFLLAKFISIHLPNIPPINSNSPSPTHKQNNGKPHPLLKHFL